MSVDINNIILTRLSYKKLQLDYIIPIYMINIKLDKKVLIESIKVSIRYQKDVAKYVKLNKPKNERYCIIYGSVATIKQNIGFKNKVGKVSADGRNFTHIDPFYETDIIIENMNFNRILSEIHVIDVRYLENFRDKKLSELL